MKCETAGLYILHLLCLFFQVLAKNQDVCSVGAACFRIPKNNNKGAHCKTIKKSREGGRDDKYLIVKIMELEMEQSKIQKLYNACNDVFAQKELPKFQQIQFVKNLIDDFEAVDVGIDEFSLPGSPATSPDGPRGLICGRGVSEITYIHIHECDSFSIGVFCFPAGAVFPLHDHPGMTVLSKILYGSVYVKAFDWVKVDTSSCRTVGLAGKVVDGIITAPSEPSILFPKSGGNIHSFTALNPCAILDVLAPPYSEELGRPSTYFHEYPISSLPGYTVLEEKDLPADLVVIGAPYLGPPFITRDDLC